VNELSPGLHAAAEQHGRGTTVYLLSGLTAAERRSALRRLRLTARMGHCPRLPAGQLAFALFMDRIRTGIGRAGAVLRLHPAGSTVPIMVLSGGAIAFLLFSTVSIHVLHPRTADQSDVGTPAASASAIAIAIGGGSQGQTAGQGGRGTQGNPGGPADPGRVSRGADTRQLTQPSGVPVTTSPALAAGDGAAAASTGSASAGSGRAGRGSSANGSGKSSGGTTLSGSANQSPVTPRQTTAATSAAAPGPAAATPATAPAAASSGSSSGTSNGVCVNVGPLGVCLNI
jgi:hypothetical protein